MIRFASLFLGLVFGIVNVELDVAREVRQVRLLLDGREVAAVEAPWRAQVDLGAALAPHELVAVALDGSGRELSRARQWVNRPRAVAEAGFVLEPGEGGAGRIARLGWMSVAKEKPASVTVTFDGRELTLRDPARIELPPHDPARVHVLRAVVDFGGEAVAVADATFGGVRRAETLTEMTALPVELEEGRALPPVEAMAGWFAREGVPLPVAAVDEGPALAVFVLAGKAEAELERMERGRGSPGPGELEMGRWDGALRKGQAFLYLWSDPGREVRWKDVLDVYPRTAEMTSRDGGVLGMGPHLTRPGSAGKERIAQAVAVAGLTAAARERRRAVVLLVGRDAADASSLPAAEAVAFLRRLHVPFQVWSVSGDPAPVASRFGPVVDASSRALFTSAVRSLSDRLDRQRIVWLAGSFLPHEVEPTTRASGLSTVFPPPSGR